MAQILSTQDIRKAPRGRKAELDPDLVALFATLEPGQMILLDTEFSPVGDDKIERGKVSQIVRKNWKHARPDAVCSVNFTIEGLAQVSIHDAKTAALLAAKAEAEAEAKPEAKPAAKAVSSGKR